MARPVGLTPNGGGLHRYLHTPGRHAVHFTWHCRNYHGALVFEHDACVPAGIVPNCSSNFFRTSLEFTTTGNMPRNYSLRLRELIFFENDSCFFFICETEKCNVLFAVCRTFTVVSEKPALIATIPSSLKPCLIIFSFFSPTFNMIGLTQSGALSNRFPIEVCASRLYLLSIPCLRQTFFLPGALPPWAREERDGVHSTSLLRVGRVLCMYYNIVWCLQSLNMVNFHTFHVVQTFYLGFSKQYTSECRIPESRYWLIRA